MSDRLITAVWLQSSSRFVHYARAIPPKLFSATLANSIVPELSCRHDRVNLLLRWSSSSFSCLCWRRCGKGGCPASIACLSALTGVNRRSTHAGSMRAPIITLRDLVSVQFLAIFWSLLHCELMHTRTPQRTALQRRRVDCHKTVMRRAHD